MFNQHKLPVLRSYNTTKIVKREVGEA